MFTTRDATDALAALTDPRALPSITALLGFGAPLRLDRRTLRSLSLGDDATHVWVSPRDDTLRALLVHLPHSDDAAARTSAICQAIARHAPERCWLVIAHVAAPARVVIAAAPPDPRATVPLVSIDPNAPRESDAETLAALVGSRDAPAMHRGAMVAAAMAAHDGFIAVVDDGRSEHPRVIAGLHADGQWRVRTDAATVRMLITEAGDALPVRRLAVAHARRMLAVWQGRARSRQLVRGGVGADGRFGIPGALLRRISSRLDAWLVQVPLAQRAAASARVTQVRAAASALHGVGAETAVAAALRESGGDEFIEALERLVQHAPSVKRVIGLQLSALLLLHRPAPAAPAPPAPSTGTAAPR